MAPLPLRQIIAIADHVPAVARLTVQDLAADKIMPYAEVIFAGLRRVYPQLTRDEFFDLPMTIPEMTDAVGTATSTPSAAASASPIGRCRNGPSTRSRTR